MKRIWLIALLIFALSVSGLAAAADVGRIIINVTTFRNYDGGLYAILYNTANAFPKETNKAFKIACSTIRNKKAQVVFDRIPYGEYAIVILHDENANRKMDYNFIGMPQEGYGFSNNTRGMLRPPAYKDAKFILDRPKLEATIELNYCKLSGVTGPK